MTSEDVTLNLEEGALLKEKALKQAEKIINFNA
jgi:hypothetical protein